MKALFQKFQDNFIQKIVGVVLAELDKKEQIKKQKSELSDVEFITISQNLTNDLASKVESVVRKTIKEEIGRKTSVCSETPRAEVLKYQKKIQNGLTPHVKLNYEAPEKFQEGNKESNISVSYFNRDGINWEEKEGYNGSRTTLVNIN